MMSFRLYLLLFAVSAVYSSSSSQLPFAEVVGVLDDKFGDGGALLSVLKDGMESQKGAMLADGKGGRVLGATNGTAVVFVAYSEREGGGGEQWTSAGPQGMRHLKDLIVYGQSVYGVGGEWMVELDMNKGNLLRAERRVGAKFASVGVSGSKVLACGSDATNVTDVVVSTWDMHQPKKEGSHFTFPSGLTGANVVVVVHQHCQYADGRLLVVGSAGHGTTSQLFMMRILPDLRGVDHVWAEDIRTSNSEMIQGCMVLPEAAQRVILVGRSDIGGFVMRYFVSGAADSTYGINKNGHSFVSQVSAFQAFNLLPDGSVVAMGHKENRLVLVKFTDGGLIDVTFGASSGMTSRSFGALTDRAFVHSLLFSASKNRWIAVGWVSFGGVEKEMVTLQYIAPQELSGCVLGPSHFCMCLEGNLCSVQGPTPLKLQTFDVATTTAAFFVNANLDLSGASVTLRVTDQGPLLFVLGTLDVEGANITVDVFAGTPPADGAIVRVARSAEHVVGRAVSVQVNATAPDSCHTFNAEQAALLQDDGFLRVRFLLRELPSCSRFPLPFSVVEILAILIGVLLVGTVVAAFAFLLVRKSRVDGSRRMVSNKTIKGVMMSEYRRG